MARKARPWFNAERRCRIVYLGGKKRHLCAADRKTKNPPKEALDRHDDLLREARRAAAPEVKTQTVTSVIERYIEVAFPSLAEGTRTLRQPIPSRDSRNGRAPIAGILRPRSSEHSSARPDARIPDAGRSRRRRHAFGACSSSCLHDAKSFRFGIR
jgi:hypothetical protein